ncbi:MAG: EamA family transporter, partial [Acidobacteriota bacterium]
MAAIRFLCAGTLLYGWCAMRGLPRPSGAQWRSAAVVGALLLVFGNGLLTWAELYVPSGVAALIVATIPLWMILLDALAERRLPSGRVLAGVALGMAGLVVLIGPGELGGEPVHLVGSLVICFAAFSWAVGSIYSRRAEQSPSTLQNVGMQMLVGGSLLLVGGLALGERVDVGEISARSWIALGYLILLGGVWSYSAYVWLLKVSTPAKVSTYAYVNPVVAVLLGWAVVGEALSPRVLLATVVVVAAVVLISSATRKPGTDGDS